MTRHRAPVVAALLAVLLIAGFIVRMVAAERRTAAALAVAESERDQAEAVAAFLEGLFTAADPYAGRQPERLDTLRVPALLARGVAQLETQWADRPVLAARMRSSIARAYRGLGSPDSADPLLQQAIDGLRTAGTDPEQLASVLNEYGQLQLARRRGADAEPLFREALELKRAAGAPDAGVVLAMRSNLAASLMEQQRYDEAGAIHDSVLLRLRSAVPVDSPLLADVSSTRGVVAVRSGDAAGAVSFMTEALAINRALLGDAHPRVGRDINNLAFVLDRSGRLAEAEPLFAESRVLHAEIFGDVHPATAMATTAHAEALARLGRHGEARPLFEHGLDLQRRLLGPRSPDLAISLGQYAALLEGAGETAAAEAAAREALEITVASLGPAHPGAGTTGGQLARLTCARGDVDAAMPLFDTAIRTLEAAHTPAHPAAVRARTDAGTCLVRHRRFDTAESMLIAAWEASRASPAGRAVAEALADLYQQWGRHADAAAFRARATAASPDPRS